MFYATADGHPGFERDPFKAVVAQIGRAHV